MEETFSSRDLRDALSSFATGVTVVTARDQAGHPIGMTASSFNSVSMDPPLILWSVTKAALSADGFKDAQHFSVHVLASEQVDVSNRFARSGIDKFEGVDWEADSNGVPILLSTTSRFDCRQWAVYEGGDHWILVGHVHNLVQENREALVFSSGSYATASPLRSDVEKLPATESAHGAVDEMLIYNLARAYNQIADRFHLAVREGGLTLSEWRILASLHGRVTRDIPDLVARTFVDPKSLEDILASMEENGLCAIERDNGASRVSGTDLGHDRVEYLIALGLEQEQEAVHSENPEMLTELIGSLQTVITNTNEW